jgi:hypothetical protein
MRKLLFLICAMFSTICYAQTKQIGSASVTVLNDKQSPVENATVQLLRIKDSALVRSAKRLFFYYDS